MGEFKWILPPKIFVDKDPYDDLLYKLFVLIINAGSMCYAVSAKYVEGLNASNYLKKDKNYYEILQFQWQSLKLGITEIFASIKDMNL